MTKTTDRLEMTRKEWIILILLVGAFALMGLSGGVKGFLSAGALGLLVWIIWRGRKL